MLISTEKVNCYLRIIALITLPRFFFFWRGYVAVFATLISRGFITVSRLQLAHLKKALNFAIQA